MPNDQEIIERFNAAEPDQLVAMLLSPTEEQVRALRTYLGDERYARMHEEAVAAATSRAVPKGNVVVIHGIMGGELTTTWKANQSKEKIWLNYLRLVLGGFSHFQLDAAGTAEVDARLSVAGTAMLKKFYGELILVLKRDWNVCDFWFDWRRDIRVSASELAAKVAQKFGNDAKFHIVAHSMGGLVARCYIGQNRQRWDKDKGQLIMLGTPNYGSFAVPQIITGLEGIVRKIAVITPGKSARDIAAIANTFPGSYQMMPTAQKFPDFYNAATWARWAAVPQAHLDAAKKFKASIDNVWDERMVYIAGYGQETIFDVDVNDLGNPKAYRSNDKGDGRVPHEFGWPPGFNNVKYVFEAHGSLPTNSSVQMAVRELLDTGKTSKLEDTPRQVVRGGVPAASEEALVAIEEQQLQDIAAQTYHGRGTTRSSQQAEEQAARAEELILRGFIDSNSPVRTAAAGGGTTSIETKEEVPGIELALFHGSVVDFKDADAVAVGVYIGVRPDSATRALDIAVTNVYAGREEDSKTEPKPEERLITQMLERGIIHGGLGQPFFLPDPRDESHHRLIAVVGMGAPGRFGTPECTVLARELCWSVGKMKRKHLATVLIGSGAGNLNTTDAVLAWLRGIRRALLGTPPEERVTKVTIVEFRASRMLDIDQAIREVQNPRPADATNAGDGEPAQPEAPPPPLVELTLKYATFDAEQRRKIEIAAIREARKDARQQVDEFRHRIERREAERRSNDIPARITVTYDDARHAFRFGAITSSAAVPEREVSLDPKLVEEAAHEIAALTLTQAQRISGDFLRKLLVPQEFREHLRGREPLVMLVDAKTARTPWEMMSYAPVEDDDRSGSHRGTAADAFLGTARGLTRQLRTTFAPPPEPPPPTHRVLRVLIVANPAADAPLPGAEKEGIRLKEVFQSFNDRQTNKEVDESKRNEVVIKTMLGPFEAKRFAVLKELMSTDYDVLHFAGHCRFDATDRTKSGWIFSDGDVLSANELNRIDRVPRFVFSNACESGITPDETKLSLAPSFAEAFFLRGVANFVCTAWPINDQAALDFALTLYENLLGVGRCTQPQQMHVAMKNARIRIAETTAGAGTWGAYQHYGNPYYRFFEKDDV